MSEETKVEKKSPVKADVTIWQPGKSIQEMLDYEDAVVGGLKIALTRLSKRKSLFNLGSIYSQLQKAGFEVDHPFIQALLKTKMGIKPTTFNGTMYKALHSDLWVELPEDKKEEEEEEAVETAPAK